MTTRPPSSPKPHTGKRRYAPARPRGATPAAASSALKHELQAVRQSFQEIQDKHRLLLEITDTGYVVVDSTGHVLDANAEYVRVSGYHEFDEIDGRNVTEWTAGYDRERNSGAVRKCIEDGSVHGLVVDYQWHDGTVVPVEVNAATLATNAGTIIVSVCRDISSRRRDEKLMVAQRELALALGTTHEFDAGLHLCLLTAIRVSGMDCGGILLLDPATGDLLLMVHEELSHAFVASMRRSPAASLRTRLVMRGTPVYQENGQLGGVLDQAQRIESLRAIAVIPFASEGWVIGCMMVASHTTDEVPHFARVALEAIAAQTSNAVERLRLLDDLRVERGLFVAGPVVVVKWDTISGKPPHYVSPNIAVQFGYTQEQFLKSIDYGAIMHPDDVVHCTAEIAQYIKERRPWYEQEYRLRHANGQYRWVYDFTVVERDAAGAITHYLSYLLDVTDRKQAELERQNIETQMLHAQKLESLGILAGGIAHDFNNILMAILGNIDLAMLDAAPGSPMQKSLQDAEQASRRAADLCRQMLAYSGRGSYQLRPHNLSEVIDDMSRLLEVSISKKATLHFNLDTQVPAIEADLSQIHQIVMNLVINASEAVAEPGGAISVSTGRLECDRAYLKGFLLGEGLAEGTYVFIEVADTGTGMDGETRSRIFDPFFTTKSSGRGLGLAAVMGIMRAHHGAIGVESQPSQGTTFRVLFPASVELAKPLPGRATAGDEWHGSGTLLLVDDEETIRIVAKKMLMLLGFSVLTAANGPEAVELFRSHAAEVTGVILDLTMPQMGGEEVFPLLRAIKSDVPVLLASGYSEQELTRRLNAQGFVGFIQKPYTLKMLSEKLRATLPGCAQAADARS